MRSDAQPMTLPCIALVLAAPRSAISLNDALFFSIEAASFRALRCRRPETARVLDRCAHNGPTTRAPRSSLVHQPAGVRETRVRGGSLDSPSSLRAHTRPLSLSLWTSGTRSRLNVEPAVRLLISQQQCGPRAEPRAYSRSCARGAHRRACMHTRSEQHYFSSQIAPSCAQRNRSKSHAEIEVCGSECKVHGTARKGS